MSVVATLGSVIVFAGLMAKKGDGIAWAWIWDVGWMWGILFIIRGKRYVCEKLTATFTSQGMSQLIKGSFYPVLEI